MNRFPGDEGWQLNRFVFHQCLLKTCRPSGTKNMPLLTELKTVPVLALLARSDACLQVYQHVQT